MTDPRLTWLLEQLEADEATAKAVIGIELWHGYTQAHAKHVATWDPARALAVVAALRQILEEHEPLVPWNRPGWTGCNNCEDGKQRLRPWPCPTVQAIAAIFADRPGFTEVWGE